MTKIIYQSFDFIAVNKEHGISVHNNEDPNNLISTLEKELKIEKLYPVHRLDKETSGIQILALNSEAARRLAEQFQSREVKKIYVGVMRGQLKEQQGLWQKPLSDRAEGRNNPQGQAKDRVPCETRFRVIVQTKYFTICEFELITGRQHQIRKHTALTNHHLVGDVRYGDAKYNKKMAAIYKTDRMFLHCSRVEIDNKIIESPSPDVFFQLMKD